MQLHGDGAAGPTNKEWWLGATAENVNTMDVNV